MEISVDKKQWPVYVLYLSWRNVLCMGSGDTKTKMGHREI